jgi:hypothetical protein
MAVEGLSGAPMGYTAVRWRHSARELQAALRRWAAYLLMPLVLAGAGAPALAAGAALPLLWAVAHPAWLLAVMAGMW